MASPRVSVLMPVYNGELFLRQAIESVLNQTYRDFEFIIIDDGSTDRSSEIVLSYGDRRIILISNCNNLGLVESLNFGLNLAKGEYVARMDADDICSKNRLLTQVRFMDRNNTVGVCGSFVRVFSDKNPTFVRKLPIKSKQIKCELFFNSALVHSTVFFRKNIFLEKKLYYDSNYFCAEDYELWTRSIDEIEFYNIPNILLSYRLNANQVTQKHKAIQNESAARIRLKMLEKIGIKPTSAEIKLHESIFDSSCVFELEQANGVDNWLAYIIHKNRNLETFDPLLFTNRVAKVWCDATINSARNGEIDFGWITKSCFWRETKFLTSVRILIVEKYLISKLKFSRRK